MQSDVLTALSPLDGRYAAGADPLRPMFSESGLIRYRVQVEVEWLIFLSEHPQIEELPEFDDAQKEALRTMVEHFSVTDAEAVKEIEKTINHDVKAVEYWLREKVSPDSRRFIHFACTSEDINNLSYALAVRDARDNVMLPIMGNAIASIAALGRDSVALPMLSRTHGQSASPTTLGKEMANVVARLTRTQEQLKNVAILGKINGAVGNYNAHVAAYPEIDWPQAGQRFVEQLGLTHNPLTTQIEPHDWMAQFFDALTRFNTIGIDFCRDSWGYISLGYLAQKTKAEEVGSSTMPHKVNPINFENAEGNFGLANALLTHLAQKLPISRWQRDLTDSTVLRNVGMALGWSLVGCQAMLKGMARVTPNAELMQADLARHVEVLAEPIQTVMKRYGIEDAYEQLKALTRGAALTAEVMEEFVSGLEIPDAARRRLLALTPETYTGVAQQLAEDHLERDD
ncbi:MAG: adenylosuccinate lyase [Gammaproteobacteria bacterium]